MTIRIGSYISYKEETFIVTELRNNMMLLILSPKAGKRQVLATKVKELPMAPAITVSVPTGKYLVTKQHLIISLTTSKIMKWEDNHGIKKQLLAYI